MARTAPDTTKRHLQPRTAILGGAALGLVVGATVYGAVSSSADAGLPQVFKAKAPVTVAPVIAPGCTGKAKLEKGVCVIHVVRTVMAPVTAAAAAPVVGQVPTSAVKPGPTARAAAIAHKASVAAKVPAARAVAHTKAPVPLPVAAVSPTAKTARAAAPAPAAKPTSTPVPTAAS